MDWTNWVIAGAVVAALVLVRRLSVIGMAKARRLMVGGGSIVDVRTREEFASDHIPGAINIPLDELPARIEREKPDKNQPLLLHCLSGGRSGLATRILRQKGYRQVYNLGSLRRARKIA